MPGCSSLGGVTELQVARPVVSKEDGKAAPSSKRKQKLAVAQQLVDELESMLSNFSDQVLPLACTEKRPPI